jgi:iron-sulfur cluster assembly protein
MSFEVTEAAVLAVKVAMRSEELSEEDVFLRVGVTPGGCSGYGYVLAFEREKRVGDSLIEQNGLRLLIDGESGPFLTGAVLDYAHGPHEEGFVFRNPNATGGGCACGSSCGC